jgi:hypothetical protein
MAKVTPRSGVSAVVNAALSTAARVGAEEVLWAELAGRECVGRSFLEKCMMASA